MKIYFYKVKGNRQLGKEVKHIGLKGKKAWK